MLKQLGLGEAEPAIVAGDLNYRVDLGPQEALHVLADAMACKVRLRQRRAQRWR